MISSRLARVALCLVTSSVTALAEVAVTAMDDRVRIDIDGKLFTEFRTKGAAHVYYWPIIGPNGAKMTRAWPMEEAPGEEHDHPHHRSMWFSHGLVNGVDFWGETASYKGDAKHPVGQIVHEKILEAKGGPKWVFSRPRKSGPHRMGAFQSPAGKLSAFIRARARSASWILK
jgi:hypothetical protein